MESFMHVTNWSQPTSRPFGHFRSHSTATSPTITTVASASPPASPKTFTIQKPKSPLKSPSTTVHSIQGSPTDLFTDEMSTLPDPRSRSMTPARQGSTASSNHHPDLNEEVASLSTKLVNAINHQTILDDTLSATRHELETANTRISELEAQTASQREILSGDVWIRRSAMEVEKKNWQAKVAEEKAKRIEVEIAKKKIEQELENLTAALFEEANKMVIRAKEEAQAEYDVVQRKNDQLKAQLADSESLLKSQQEQLSELKLVMETITSEKDDQTNPTAPSSPGIARLEMGEDDRFISHTPTSSGPIEAAVPAPPTSFPHLVQPVLRYDVTSYDDFVNLARLSRQRNGARVSSGSLGGLSLPSLGLGGSLSSTHPGNSSTTSLNTLGANSVPHSPNTPGTNAAPTSPVPIPPIRDTRFFKRVLAEDIEPTLRLDAAPGLSWLARRSVMSAIVDGSLVVEPVVTHSGNSFIMSIAKPQFNACSLCGESRKNPLYLRNHRFRTSEQESAQRYPLCKYCLTRIRSTCDFLSFLRMVKDGHWKAEDDDQEKAAWEESVRLRDQMFWARLGGGVVPFGHNAVADKSPRPSEEQSKGAEGSPESNTKEGGSPSFTDAAETLQDDNGGTMLPESEDSTDVPASAAIEGPESAAESAPAAQEASESKKVDNPQTPPEQTAKN